MDLLFNIFLIAGRLKKQEKSVSEICFINIF
jgi:hypothetical protein